MLCGDCLMHCNSLPALFCICIFICSCICIYGALACLGIFGALQLDADLEPGWIFFDQLTSRFGFLSFPLFAKSHSFPQFLGGNQRGGGLNPLIFLGSALFAFAGKRGAASPIWYSAYTAYKYYYDIQHTRGKEMVPACAWSWACSANNNLRYVAAEGLLQIQIQMKS